MSSPPNALVSWWKGLFEDDDDKRTNVDKVHGVPVSPVSPLNTPGQREQLRSQRLLEREARMREQQAQMVAQGDVTTVSTDSSGASASGWNQPGLRYELELKILVVGGKRVGKTSIVRRYTQDCFTSEYEPTVGVDWFSSLFSGEQFHSHSHSHHRPVRLNFWDVSHAELNSTQTDFLLQGMHGAILVFDIADKSTVEAVDQWRALIAEHLEREKKKAERRERQAGKPGGGGPQGSRLNRWKHNTAEILEPGEQPPMILLAHKSDEGKSLVKPSDLDEYTNGCGYLGWWLTTAREGDEVFESIDHLVWSILRIRKEKKKQQQKLLEQRERARLARREKRRAQRERHLRGERNNSGSNNNNNNNDNDVSGMTVGSLDDTGDVSSEWSRELELEAVQEQDETPVAAGDTLDGSPSSSGSAFPVSKVDVRYQSMLQSSAMAGSKYKHARRLGHGGGDVVRKVSFENGEEEEKEEEEEEEKDRQQKEDNGDVQDDGNEGPETVLDVLEGRVHQFYARLEGDLLGFLDCVAEERKGDVQVLLEQLPQEKKRFLERIEMARLSKGSRRTSAAQRLFADLTRKWKSVVRNLDMEVGLASQGGVGADGMSTMGAINERGEYGEALPYGSSPSKGSGARVRDRSALVKGRKLEAGVAIPGARVGDEAGTGGGSEVDTTSQGSTVSESSSSSVSAVSFSTWSMDDSVNNDSFSGSQSSSFASKPILVSSVLSSPSKGSSTGTGPGTGGSYGSSQPSSGSLGFRFRSAKTLSSFVGNESQGLR